MDNNISINGFIWDIKIVEPNNLKLIDRTNTARVATTDPINFTIYLSSELEGHFLVTVLRHELCHAVLFSYGLLKEIHNLVPPERWIEAEEWICNLIANYSPYILSLSQDILNK